MFYKYNPEIGARPGTLAIPSGAPPPEIHLVLYSASSIDESVVDDPRKLASLRLEPGRLAWIDLHGLGDESALRAVADAFRLHPLTLEDAVNIPQRAKSEVRGDHQVVVARVPVREKPGQVEAPQVCFVIGRDHLITFQERYFGFFEAVRKRLREGIGPIRTLGPDYLAYALIDALIDRYYPLAQALSDEVEEIDEELTDDPADDLLSRVHILRRQLTVVRRVGWPQREAIRSMQHDVSPMVSAEVRSFLSDTLGHISQIMELVDSAREMAISISEAYLSRVSQRTNEIMKVLTLMASIFIPLSFIAGVYGMNFDNMPELHHPFAYYGVLAGMLSVAVGLVLYFRYRGWIGSPRRRARARVQAS